MTDYYKHPTALIEDGARIGKGTKIWAFVHVLPGAVIGSNCNICDNVFIEGGSTIGDNVTIKCGVQIWSGVNIESDVFVGPNVTFTNDPFPRSKRHLSQHPITTISHHASLGANATILPGIKIGSYAMVGAGSVVTKNVPDKGIVAGNPACIIGYDTTGREKRVKNRVQPGEDFPPTSDPFCRRVLEHSDARGSLSVLSFKNDIPFVPKRMFWVYDVPSGNVRGEHAHRAQEQYLINVRGSVNVALDDGTVAKEYILDKPNVGLYIPKMVWSSQYKHTADACLVVFSSGEYEAEDYIRDYDEFLKCQKEIR